MQKSTFEARIVPMERKKNRRTSAHPETQKREAAPFVWEIRGAAPVLGSAPEKPAAQEPGEMAEETILTTAQRKAPEEAPTVLQEQAGAAEADAEKEEPKVPVFSIEKEAEPALETAAPLDIAGAAPSAEDNPDAAEDPAAYENNGVERVETDNEEFDRTISMTYEEFLAANPKSGMLRVQVFAGNRSVPVENVRVAVSKQFTDGLHEFYVVYTNQSGIADDMILPAPDRQLSQQPGDCCPYADYQVTTSKNGFQTMVYMDVPVYDGIKSIQPARMIPEM